MAVEDGHQRLLTPSDRQQDNEGLLIRTAPAGMSQYTGGSSAVSPAPLPSPAHINTSPSYTVYAPPSFQSARPEPLILYPMPTPTSASTSAFSSGMPLTAIPMALDTILLRSQYRFSWTSYSNQYLFPAELPPFSSPHLASYISPEEWKATVSRLNAALQWPRHVQLMRLLTGLLLLISFCGIWVKSVRKERGYTVAVWSVMVLSGLAFIILTRVYAARVRRRLEAAVRAESAYYSSSAAERQGRLQSSWRMEDRQLVVSAPTLSPQAHHFPLAIAMPPPSTQRGSVHDYQHELHSSTNRGSQHSPMAHY
jgi:hypothetical protein